MIKEHQQIGREAAKIAQAEVLRMANKKGITLERTMMRLKQAMDAKEVKVFKQSAGDGLIYSKALVAHGTRLAAVKIALELQDAFPSQKHEVDVSGVIGLKDVLDEIEQDSGYKPNGQQTEG